MYIKLGGGAKKQRCDDLYSAEKKGYVIQVSSLYPPSSFSSRSNLFPNADKSKLCVFCVKPDLMQI